MCGRCYVWIGLWLGIRWGLQWPRTSCPIVSASSSCSFTLGPPDWLCCSPSSGFSFLGSSLGEKIQKVLVHHCLFFTRLFRFPRKEALFTSLVLFRLNGFLVVPPFRMGSALVIAGGAGLWAHTLVLVDAYQCARGAVFLRCLAFVVTGVVSVILLLPLVFLWLLGRSLA